MAIRFVVDQVLTAAECDELVFVHKALSLKGYRPAVYATTLHEVIRTDPLLLPPVVSARSRIWDVVEDKFGLACLHVEFTGLVSWTAGASIGWHHDSNREYLKQRYISAVLYLNEAAKDFAGGEFQFLTGPQPLQVTPVAGRLVAYLSDEQNVHRVEPVTAGERCTMAMWFTLDPGHQEDVALLKSLAALGPNLRALGVPHSMYELEDGQDLRQLRLTEAGLIAHTADTTVAASSATSQDAAGYQGWCEAAPRDSHSEQRSAKRTCLQGRGDGSMLQAEATAASTRSAEELDNSAPEQSGLSGATTASPMPGIQQKDLHRDHQCLASVAEVAEMDAQHGQMGAANGVSLRCRLCCIQRGVRGDGARGAAPQFADLNAALCALQFAIWQREYPASSGTLTSPQPPVGDMSSPAGTPDTSVLESDGLPSAPVSGICGLQPISPAAADGFDAAGRSAALGQRQRSNVACLVASSEQATHSSVVCMACELLQDLPMVAGQLAQYKDRLRTQLLGVLDDWLYGGVIQLMHD